MRRGITLFCLLIMTICCVFGCRKKESASLNNKLDTSKDIILTIIGNSKNYTAIDKLGQSFTKLYPNCTVEYEYMQNYKENVTKRLNDPEEKADIFFTVNIQEDSELLPMALDLNSQSGLDLSDTYKGLIDNYILKGTDKLYAIPIGAEVRGMYVNTTLIAEYGIEIPKNLNELMNACKILSDKGYIPIQGNPGMFAQQLIYPYICNQIANAADYESAFNKVNQCEEGVEKMFEEPFQVLYDLIYNNYYNYKKAETEYGLFLSTEPEEYAKCFLGIDDDSLEADNENIGKVPFMVSSASLSAVIDKVKDDYHSNIDYEFIMAPLSEDGGFAYLSPSDGIAVNKNSDHVDWAVEFLNFMFDEENSSTFAADMNIIPNNTNAFSYVSETYDIPKNHISQLGQATFDYDFYSLICDTATTVSKGNNPKYMDSDENGNAVLYSYDYYMNMLKDAFDKQREGGE